MADPQIDGFEIVSPLTVAGKVWSYVAKQESMDRLVTLCVLSPEVARDPNAIRDFMAQVKAAAQRDAGPALAIINVGSQPPYHYVVAEHAPGKTLAQQVDEQGPMDDAHATETLKGIAKALSVCAAAEMVHGELRASDVIVDGTGAYRLARMGFMAAVRNRTDLQVYIQRDLYSLGNILKQLVSGSEVLELSFAADAGGSVASGDDRSVDAIVAKLQGSGEDALTSYDEFLAWLEREPIAVRDKSDDEELPFSFADDVASGGPPTPDVAMPSPAAGEAPAKAVEDHTPTPAPLMDISGSQDELPVLEAADPEADDSKAETVYASAVRSMQTHQYKHAIQQLRRLPKNYADVAARLSEAQGKLKAWYDHIEAGKKLWEQGKPSEAIEHWNAALLIRPDNRTLKHKIAQAKSLAGREVMVSDYLNEAKRHIREGDLPAARLACQQGLKIVPDSEAAKKQLAEIDQIQVATDADACRQEGDTLHAQKRYGEAIAMWEKAVAMNPADVSLAQELKPLIQEARKKRRSFIMLMVVGAIVVIAALAGAVVLALSRR